VNIYFILFGLSCVGTGFCLGWIVRAKMAEREEGALIATIKYQRERLSEKTQ